MMKRLALVVVLIGIMFFPSLVSAYELSCGSGPYSFNDSFMCTVKGANNINYDVMMGTLENSDNVSCITTSYAEGMHSKENEEVSNKFNITGRSANDDLVSFKCQVIGKPTEDTSMQLFINDFTYHDSSSSSREQAEILRSNTFALKKYDEQATNPVDKKPRDTSNSNSRLKGISAEGLDFTFSQFITEYNIDVVFEVDQIELLVLANNLEATYRIVGSQKLSIGDNTIDVYVTSPDGKATTCYTLYIKRLPRGEKVYHAESDATLKDLIISGQQNIKFEKETLEYTINIGYGVDSVDINAVPSVEGAKVTIVNSTGLKNGDVISIIVESQNGTDSKRYLINVNKAAEPYDYSKILTLGGIGLAVLVIIILVIRSSKKSKEDPLLKLKKDKRTINKGESFDPNAVPEATSTIQNQQTQPNVIKADNVSVATPMMVDPNAVDTNLNKISTNVNTLDLNSTALPSQLPVDNNTGVNQAAPAMNTPQINNIENSPVGQESVQSTPVNTLDLSSVAVPVPTNSTGNIFDAPVNQVVPQGQMSAQPVSMVYSDQPISQPNLGSQINQGQVGGVQVPPNNNQN